MRAVDAVPSAIFRRAIGSAAPSSAVYFLNGKETLIEGSEAPIEHFAELGKSRAGLRVGGTDVHQCAAALWPWNRRP